MSKYTHEDPRNEPWYPFIDLNDCPRFSPCFNCLRKNCPVVDKAVLRLRSSNNSRKYEK